MFSAMDEDEDAFTMSATSIATWLTFDIVSGTLTGTPSSCDVGDQSITLAVTDGIDKVSQSFTITVAEELSSGPMDV